MHDHPHRDRIHQPCGVVVEAKRMRSAKSDDREQCQECDERVLVVKTSGDGYESHHAHICAHEPQRGEDDQRRLENGSAFVDQPPARPGHEAPRDGEHGGRRQGAPAPVDEELPGPRSTVEDHLMWLAKPPTMKKTGITRSSQRPHPPERDLGERIRVDEMTRRIAMSDRQRPVPRNHDEDARRSHRIDHPVPIWRCSSTSRAPR